MKANNQKKIAVIYSKILSNWTSCQHITRNLLDTYRTSFPNITEFAHDSKYASCGEYLTITQQLLEGDFDEICFIEHMPRSLSIIGRLFEVAHKKELELPIVNIHIYGDYSIFGNVFHQMNSNMYGQRVRFICASSRQSLLVSSTLNTHSENYCDLVPFSVSKDSFYFDSTLREKFRTERNILDDEYVFCYVGRISLQKNVINVIEHFARACTYLNGKCRLYLAGPIDEIALPFFDYSPPQGFYQSALLNKISSLPTEVQERIEYVGSLGHTEVLELFNGSDCHLSFSLYHDEDFGMGIIEGLFTGIPSIITNWGGYADFDVDQPNLKYLPVKLSDDGITVSYDDLPEFISYFHKMRRSFTGERQYIGKCYQDRFSIAANSQKLQEVLETVPAKRFPGFAHFINKLNTKRKFDINNMEKSLYGNLYNNYTQSEES